MCLLAWASDHFLKTERVLSSLPHSTWLPHPHHFQNPSQHAVKLFPRTFAKALEPKPWENALCQHSFFLTFSPFSGPAPWSTLRCTFPVPSNTFGSDLAAVLINLLLFEHCQYHPDWVMRLDLCYWIQEQRQGRYHAGKIPWFSQVPASVELLHRPSVKGGGLMSSRGRVSGLILHAQSSGDLGFAWCHVMPCGCHGHPHRSPS